MELVVICIRARIASCDWWLANVPMAFNSVRVYGAFRIQQAPKTSGRSIDV